MRDHLNLVYLARCDRVLFQIALFWFQPLRWFSHFNRFARSTLRFVSLWPESTGECWPVRPRSFCVLFRYSAHAVSAGLRVLSVRLASFAGSALAGAFLRLRGRVWCVHLLLGIDFYEERFIFLGVFQLFMPIIAVATQLPIKIRTTLNMNKSLSVLMYQENVFFFTPFVMKNKITHSFIAYLAL